MIDTIDSAVLSNLDRYHDLREPRVFVFRREGGRYWYVVHPSTKHHGWVQITSWDSHGPISDYTIKTPEDAVRTLSGRFLDHFGAPLGGTEWVLVIEEW